MGRFDNIHGDEEYIEYENKLIQELRDYDEEERGVEEWKLSRLD